MMDGMGDAGDSMNAKESGHNRKHKHKNTATTNHDASVTP
jgi:hypothetical protein